jgi:hypothetical protein
MKSCIPPPKFYFIAVHKFLQSQKLIINENRNLHTPDSFAMCRQQTQKSREIMNENSYTPDSFIIAVNKLLKVRETYHQYIFHECMFVSFPEQTSQK